MSDGGHGSGHSGHGRGRGPRRDGGNRREDGIRQNPDRRDAQGRTRNRGRSGGPRRYSAAAPAQRQRRADPARLVAFETLTAVSTEDAYANLVLPALIAQRRLDQRDAAFATELAYGSLRGQGFYDAVLARCVDRPLERLDAPVLDALRLGAHQLLGMRVPAHAALDSTVALVRDRIGAGPSGLVNAVLRKVSAQDTDEWAELIAPAGGSDPDAALALRTSHPEWIVRSLRQALAAHGRDTRELTDLLAADNAAPVVNLVALPGLGDLGPVLEAGAMRGPLAPGSALFRGGDTARLPGVRQGAVRVQDVGSQLTARALAQAPLTGRDERWLDLCAGPGGKAALLAALASQRGATLLANEPAAHRTRLVEQALRPIPESTWSVRPGDGREVGREHPQAFDRILVDAPCTGLGALRRRPEARWRRQPSDLAALTGLQRELLDAAVTALRPGGLLGYVACSPHVAETVLQVQDVLTRHPGLELTDTAGGLVAVARPDDGAGEDREAEGVDAAEDAAPALNRDSITAEPAGSTTAQLWPHLHGTDAMFMALLRKRPDQRQS